jgi:hypothetical protein
MHGMRSLKKLHGMGSLKMHGMRSLKKCMDWKVSKKDARNGMFKKMHGVGSFKKCTEWNV